MIEDCGYRAPRSGNKRPRPGCECQACLALRAAKRAAHRVANMTADQRERRNALQRVASMTPAQLKEHRQAGAERSRLHRRRRADAKAERVAEHGADCDNRSTSNERRPRRGCQCVRCVELRAERNKKRRVTAISEAERERQNAAQRFDNLTEEQRERRRARQRVENLTPDQLRKQREAAAERNRRYRARQREEGK